MEQHWRIFSQRPTVRLTFLFFGRMLYSNQSESDEVSSSVALVFAFLALPGAFISLFLLNKYSSLLQFMRGQLHFDPYAASLADEYFFIVLSMVVAGAVALWKWDSIFLDRRDYLNLFPLPLSTLQIALANAVAIIAFSAVFVIDVTAASAVLFPFIVSASQDTFGFYFAFARGHIVSTALASAFSFLSIFSVIGLLMVILPQSLFRQFSGYARALIGGFLVYLLSSSFVTASLLEKRPDTLAFASNFSPPVWFLGLCQSLRGTVDIHARQEARLAVLALCATVLIVVITCGISYRRNFVKTLENEPAIPMQSGRLAAAAWGFADKWFFRTPSERGCMRFVIKTLLRSESQRVVWAASLGLGLVMAAIVLVSTFQGHAVTANADPSSQILALPLVISYCGIIGLRFVFDIPVDLRANWIFRVMLDTQEHNCLAVARKTMFICVVSSVSVMTLVAFTLFWGWRLGVQHSVLVASCSWLLIEVSIVSLRKLPFTCSAQEFHSRGLVNALGYVLGLFVFAFSTTSIEHWCIRAPFRMLLFVPLLATGFWLARRYRNELLDNEKTLIFEDSTASSLELLNLVGQPNA